MRKTIVIAWLSALFLGILVIFWHNEWVYGLPTPVPAAYKAVQPGAPIAAAQKLVSGKPLFLHFFNPDCPCSRFNINYFKTLASKYQHEASFVIIPVSNKPLTEKAIREKFGLNIPVVFDTTLAAACGVYSTPQAAIIDNHSTLYYRGNYNKSRYCTNAETNYAEIALQALLNRSKVAFDQYALQAYGCQLPNCTK
jgi:hypothetical protein